MSRHRGEMLLGSNCTGSLPVPSRKSSKDLPGALSASQRHIRLQTLAAPALHAMCKGVDLDLLVVGNSSLGKIPFVTNSKSGCVNFPKVSSSSIISPVRIDSVFPLIVDGIDVCRFLYTVGLLSSVRTACAVAFARWCVYASLIHSNRTSYSTS